MFSFPEIQSHGTWRQGKNREEIPPPSTLKETIFQQHCHLKKQLSWIRPSLFQHWKLTKISFHPVCQVSALRRWTTSQSARGQTSVGDKQPPGPRHHREYQGKRTWCKWSSILWMLSQSRDRHEQLDSVCSLGILYWLHDRHQEDNDIPNLLV